MGRRDDDEMWVLYLGSAHEVPARLVPLGLNGPNGVSRAWRLVIGWFQWRPPAAQRHRLELDLGASPYYQMLVEVAPAASIKSLPKTLNRKPCLYCRVYPHSLMR